MNNHTTRRRRVQIALACAAAGTMITACGGTGGGGDGEKFVLGHSYQNLSNQFFADELEVEEALANERGIEILSAQAADNPATQLQDVNTLITRGVDVLAIDAIDPDAIVPGLAAAEDAGIPVIALVREPSSGTYESLIYLDSVKDGYNACKYIADQLGGEGKVVNLTGPLEILAAKERADGCDKALSESSGIEVVARPNTDYTLRDAEQKMTDVLQAQGEIDAVFGGNDDVALGAIRALAAAGQDPTEKVIVGVDGTEAALTAICEGSMSQTMATFPAAEAALVIDTAESIVKGEKVDPKILFPAVAVNANNLQEMAETAGVKLGDCAAS